MRLESSGRDPSFLGTPCGQAIVSVNRYPVLRTGSPYRGERARGVKHSRDSGRRRARALGGLVTTVTLGGWLALAAVPASAGIVTCTQGVGTIVITIDDAGGPDTLARTAGGAITGNGAPLPGPCSSATVTNTDSITVNGGAGGESLTLDLGNGGFVDAFGDEVDIALALGGGADTLTITGTASADNVRFGSDNSVNLTGDADADLTGADTAESITVNAGDGDDTVSGAGGLGTGSSAFAGALTLNGGIGKDTLTGGGGADTINGDAGDDAIDGAGGADAAVNGGADNDTVNGGSGNDVALNGDAGDDTVDGGDGNDAAVNGGPGTDTVRGGSGSDTLNGGTEDDSLEGGTGDDTMNGDAGDDLYLQGTSTNGADTMSDTGGTADKVDYSGRTNPVKIIDDGVVPGVSGETGEHDVVSTDINILVGGKGADTITIDGSSAEPGTAIGGPGGDSLTSAGTVDTLSYEGSTTTVSVDLSKDSNSATAGLQPTVSGGDAQGDKVSAGFENVTGSEATDTLIGANAAPNADNTINGGKGADKVTGGDGSDTLFGGDGNDSYDEGSTKNGNDLIGDDPATAANEDPGSDTVLYTARTNAVVVDLDGAADDGESAAPAETDNVNTENVWGGAGADTMTGNAGDNVIAGNAGADTLDGAAGTDTTDYSADSAGVKVNLATQAASGGDAEGDTIANFENATGGAGGDSLTGTDTENVLIGNAGNDRFVGRGADDTIRGGAGKDTVNYSASTSRVAVNLKTGVGAGITDGRDILAGIENATGTLFKDILTGNNAANVLRGGDGRDNLRGLSGRDKLLGGAGRDTGDGGKGIDTCKSIERERNCEK
jgi:Ca2+-binding RTX toxin-like protein